MKKKLVAGAAAVMVILVCVFGGLLIKNYGMDTLQEAFFGAREIVFSEKEFSLEPGQEKALEAALSPKRASIKRIQWSSSNEALVKVQDGTVTALREGTAVITAVSGAAKAQITVQVALRPGSLTLDKSHFYLGTGQAQKLTALQYPTDKAVAGVSYECSAPQIASVDAAGTVTAKALGKAEITASVNGKKAYCTVEVIQTPSRVVFGQSKAKMAVGQAVALPMTLEPEGADGRGLDWKTSNARVAEYQDGKIRAVGAGTCTITAVAGGNRASITVTVIETDLVVKLTESVLSLNVGERARLDYILMTPSNTQHGTPKWESSNNQVAAVDSSGNITALQKGTAFITITTDIGQAMCKVTVK